MVDLPSERLDSVVAGGVIGGLGVVLTGVHSLHGIEEITETLPAVIYGVVVPLLVSLSILGGGYWVARRDWTDVSPWRLVGWCGGGLAVGVGLVLLLVQYQAAERTVLSDRAFVIAMFGTYGAAAGLLLGRYDVQRRARHVQLRRETQRLDEFASIVSHDLRNPLNVATGHVELARDTGDPSHLETATDALDRMEMIVTETLTLARQGNEALTPEPVNVADAAAESWEMIEHDAAEVAVTTDQRVRADRDRLGALFENLFRNAIEHNEPPVTVTVGALEHGEGFYVEDDGKGIPPERRETVFEGGFSTTERGTGLGLPIVRAAADAHGWSVTLTEGDSGGARFEIAAVETVDYRTA